MTEQFEEMMRKTARNINVGYLSALFDTAIETISKIAVDERISEPIHKAINPMLDDMIGQLHSMKNNTMATMMFEGGEETKVMQPKSLNVTKEEVAQFVESICAELTTKAREESAMADSYLYDRSELGLKRYWKHIGTVTGYRLSGAIIEADLTNFLGGKE